MQLAECYMQFSECQLHGPSNQPGMVLMCAEKQRFVAIFRVFS